MKRDQFRIYLNLKVSKTEQGVAPLYCRILNQGYARFEINSGILMQPDLWNQQCQNLNHPHLHRNLYKSIQEFTSKIAGIHEGLVQTGGMYSPETFKRMVKGEKTKMELRPSFTFIYKKHLAIEGTELAPGTWKNYRSTNHMFLRFLAEEYNLSDIDLMHINRKVIIEFMSWLKQKPAIASRKCNLSGAQKHYERLNKLLNFAVSMQYIEFNPATGVRKRHIQKERTCLVKEELIKLINHQFSERWLTEARDTFIFSCYTGLSYADTLSLKEDDIIVDIYNKPAIHKIREKTHRSREIKFYVPLLDIPKEIIRSYRDHIICKIKGTLLPVKSNQEYNRNLKIIAELTGISKKLTSHVARHTFATTITQDNGISLEAISEMLGHTQIKTTQIYSKTTMMRVYSEMKDLKVNLENTENEKLSAG